ncbi:putative membrane protein [Rhodoplanes tepidamans]|nr:putative membrane protein [Rhodoplanes tepidamans]
MLSFDPLDLVAIGIFVVAWASYAITMEWTRFGRGALNSQMDEIRAIWMRRMLRRESRIVDAQIMAALQNGAAFFASTSLLAIGAALTLVRSTDQVVSVLSTLPLSLPTARELWEAKAVGLVVIFVYTFYKFAWSYRLFNYVAIMLGATPPAAEQGSEEAERHIRRTTRLFRSAGLHFNRGQRALFFALAYLGWFVGPWVLIAATVAVVLVVWHRQYASDSLRALRDEPD